MSLPNSHVEVLTSNVTVFGDGIREEEFRLNEIRRVSGAGALVRRGRDTIALSLPTM